jgi:hypothetical protein
MELQINLELNNNLTYVFGTVFRDANNKIYLGKIHWSSSLVFKSHTGTEFFAGKTHLTLKKHLFFRFFSVKKSQNNQIPPPK